MSQQPFVTPDAQQRIRQLSRLVEISVILNSTLDLDPLLGFIIQCAAEVLECEATSILLYDEKRGELVFTAASGTDPVRLAQIPVPLDGSIAGTIFCENRPLVINDVASDPRHYNQVGKQIEFRPRSLLGVPMRIQDRSTGVLEALNKRCGDFTPDDIAILSVIASQAAVAIHNARLVQALRKAYEEVSRLDKLKGDFMAIASHELRTPLGVILGYATFLKEEAQGDLSDHATAVLNSALRMRTLVEDMTNMNLLQIGAAKFDVKILAIQSIVQAACTEVSATAEAKGQKLSVSLPQEEIPIQADAAKLERVFINLLNNAIRFTPAGGAISVSIYEIHREVWVEIKDTGIGIPPAELENIFKEFYQVEDHMRRHYGGLGLGLAIARGLVELHKGRIWAESEGEGKGATLKVALQRAD